MCNEARLHQEGEAWQLEGDPTEGALLSLGLKLGLDPQALAAERPRSDAIPFESEHRFMATPAPRPRRPGDGLPEGRAGAHPRHVRG
ncbi:hypothetical protein P4233_15025 [Pseudomonas aeruginosa]|nr:hypothetical protein [Pseudomonas aeruginosa]